ncbi:MAG TPA: sugar nucleotide-binding protein [Clostridia bacterium]|nr:sugar nucleotide-binding protein [Clostridia bacterium]
MNILILGASGLIGSAVCRDSGADYRVFGTYLRNKCDIPVHWLKFDISGDDIAKSLGTANPDVIIAGLRGDFNDQLRVHRQAADWAMQNKARLIFLSTANVFDASPDRPHTECDLPKAISEYGKYKIECERMLTGTLKEQAVIVRLPLVLNRKRLQTFVSNNLSGNDRMYANFYRSINTDTAVAKAIRYIIENNLSGTVHLGSSDCIRDSDFMIKAAKRLNLPADRLNEDKLTEESFCSALSCSSTDELTVQRNGSFYQVLNTNRADIPTEFHPSCEEVINSAYAV